ncbi:MAG: GHKL domain-containing protein [Olsenella sp.]|nr:GHKL domain-containing protein [Olsenella sp.]
MLKQLKRKFIAIVMVLVGTVLVAVLAVSLYSTYAGQRELIVGALNRNLEGKIDSVPTIGMGAPRPDDDTGARGRNMIALAVEVSSDGVILETSDSHVYINSSLLNRVVQEALTSDGDFGDDRSIHVSWKSKRLDEGGMRVAIVDTTDADTTMQALLIRDLEIVIAGLAVLFAITYALANWALAPVAAAWEQQRRFVADASHELKTPLAVILANNEILEKDEGIPSGSRRWIQSTADEARHMKSLVNDLLQLARTDEEAAGLASAMRREELDLSDIVDKSALEFDAVAFERGCMIEAQIEPGIKMRGDREWMERLVIILIDNACKYCAPESTIRLSLRREGQHVVYSVNNQGPVIGPEELDHLFDRFYRSDKARSRSQSQGGFGLGLAIAKSTAEAHGGRIKATSTESDGTTFSITF